MRAAVALLVAVLAGPAVAAVVTIDPDGDLRVDGAPFFPIGIVHVSWIGDRNGEKTIPDLELAAGAGFNTFQATLDNRASVGDMLDVAAARGVRILAEIPLPATGPDDFVNRWKDRAPIIGWIVADDFNTPYAGPSYDHPPAAIAALTADVHALAPDHITYASGGSYPGFRIAEFVGAMDLMGFQSYPVGAQNHPDDFALEEHMQSMDWVRDQLAGSGQPFVVNTQAYRWDGGGRYPTPREARSFLYGSLLRGAKGILWYAMWEGSDRHLPTHAPALWAELGRLNAETASLVPFLLHGTRIELATGDPRIYASSWQRDGQVLVVALSTLRAGARSVALPLPAGAVGPAHALFLDRPESGLDVASGALAGSIGPEEVHVALVDLAAPGNQSPVAAFDVAPASVAFGEPATLDASASSDPDGSVVAWSWDFGDGSTGTGETVVHTWTTPGTYPVRLTVRDDDGAARTTVTALLVGITSLCPPTPVAGCRRARSSLTLRDTGVAAKRALTWTWKGGAAAPADLGVPTAGTEYGVCVYDAGGLVLATGTRGVAGWSALGTTGWKLRERSGQPGGLGQAKLVAGAKTTLTLKGKGALPPAPSLPLAAPVTAQLVTSGGAACWAGVYAGSGARSTATSFRGKDG